VDRWRAVAEAINARGFEVVLTGGPGDVDPTDALVRAWREDGVRVRSAAGTTPAETLVWLRFASGVISVNTGVMHLAAAVGAPVVAINGPTPVRRWGPVGSPSRCVVSPMIPDGYLNLGWEHDDRYRDAMSAIPVDSVLAAWDDLMTELDSPSEACQ
jgi:heptosyltransferase-3